MPLNHAQMHLNNLSKSPIYSEVNYILPAIVSRFCSRFAQMDVVISEETIIVQVANDIDLDNSYSIVVKLASRREAKSTLNENTNFDFIFGGASKNMRAMPGSCDGR